MGTSSLFFVSLNLYTAASTDYISVIFLRTKWCNVSFTSFVFSPKSFAHSLSLIHDDDVHYQPCSLYRGANEFARRYWYINGAIAFKAGSEDVYVWRCKCVVVGHRYPVSCRATLSASCRRTNEVLWAIQ